MRIISVVALILVAGCASQSGIAPMGGGMYVASKQAATGFPGLGNLKAEVLRESDKFCAERKQDFLVVSTTETRPPYIAGNYPRAEVQFRCVDKQ